LLLWRYKKTLLESRFDLTNILQVFALAHEGFRLTRLVTSGVAEIASKRQRSSWSDLGPAAVDEELDAGDVAAFVESEEDVVRPVTLAIESE